MRKEIVILGAVAIAVIVIAVIGASYYRSSVQNERITTASSNSSGAAVSVENLVRPDSPTLGPVNAPVTLVEFLDPECESCAAFSPVVKNILKENEGKIRFVVRYMPLHPNSLNAATFTEAAGEQGKYWEAQELLFKKQPEWGTKHGASAAEQPEISALLKKYADELKLDKAKIDGVFIEKRYTAKLQRDLKDGQALGVRQTPTFFVNGRRLARFSEADLRALIKEELPQ